MKKRGQSSVEALILIAIILVVLMSIISFKEEALFGMSNSYYATKVKVVADKIVQGANLVYSQGSGAKTVLFITIPKEITNISLSGHIMSLNYNISGKGETLFRKTDFVLNGNVPIGIGNYCVLLESFAGYVEVSNFNGSC